MTAVVASRAMTVDLCFTKRKLSIVTGYTDLPETFIFGTSWSASDPVGSGPVIGTLT
jgi:hypothetical protein